MQLNLNKQQKDGTQKKPRDWKWTGNQIRFIVNHGKIPLGIFRLDHDALESAHPGGHFRQADREGLQRNPRIQQLPTAGDPLASVGKQQFHEVRDSVTTHGHFFHYKNVWLSTENLMTFVQIIERNWTLYELMPAFVYKNGKTSVGLPVYSGLYVSMPCIIHMVSC